MSMNKKRRLENIQKRERNRKAKKRRQRNISKRKPEKRKTQIKTNGINIAHNTENIRRLNNRAIRMLSRETAEATKRKREIVEKYGIEPTICYYYYLWNAVDYVGEKTVRESFESMRGQGDEIIVGDYSSTDGTPEIAKEYGFKVINVETT
ncbi:unnamed protein product, partial [marine sediment metagenome]